MGRESCSLNMNTGLISIRIDLIIHECKMSILIFFSCASDVKVEWMRCSEREGGKVFNVCHSTNGRESYDP